MATANRRRVTVSATVLPDMRIRGARARVPAWFAFWAMAGVALLASHDAIYAVQVGPGEALANVLRRAGHDYWGAASLALTLIGLVACGAAAVRLRRLGRRASTLPRVAAIEGQPTLRTRLPHLWVRLFAVVVIGFVLQENLEHALAHGHALGLGALFGPDYPLAIPVIAGVTLLAAIIAAFLVGRERRLLAMIAAATQAGRPRAPRAVPRPPLRLSLPRVAPMGGAVAGRAPPHRFVLTA